MKKKVKVPENEQESESALNSLGANTVKGPKNENENESPINSLGANTVKGPANENESESAINSLCMLGHFSVLPMQDDFSK